MYHRILSVLPDNFVDFRWDVPEHRFEWVEICLQGAQQPCLVERRVPLDDISGARTLAPETGASALDPFPRPLNITGLFRIFADTEPTREGIQHFANRYGRLGVGFSGPLENPGEEELSRDRHGETLELWAFEILGMRHAVEFWEHIRAGDIKSVSRFIREVPDDHTTMVCYIGPEIPIGASESPQKSFQIGWITDGNRPDGSPYGRQNFVSWGPSSVRMGCPRPVLFPVSDVLAPAWSALQGIINLKLGKNPVIPTLAWTRRETKKALRVRVIPSSLLAAIWMQFATAVEGGKEYRQCDTCKTWFEVSAHARAGAKFCRKACRFKAYRMRQAKARELYSLGVAVSEMAKLLNSDVETVKGWLGK
jgi:hypothetical protein